MNSTPGRKILIVDDEPEIRTLVAEILTQNGFEIQEAGSASEAILILHVFAPDLLITDYSLPDADGGALAEQAKRMLPHVKCLMLSGWREFPSHLSISSLADIIMSKPFSVEALEVETQRLLFTAPKERDSASSVAHEAR